MKVGLKRLMLLIMCMILALGVCQGALAQDTSIETSEGLKLDLSKSKVVLLDEKAVAEVIQQLIDTLKDTTSDTWIADLRTLAGIIADNIVTVSRWIGKYGNGINGAELAAITTTLINRPGDTTYMHGDKQYIMSDSLTKVLEHYETKNNEMFKQTIGLPTNRDFARYVLEQPGEGDTYTINGFKYVPFINNTSGNIMISNRTAQAVMQAELIRAKEGEEVAESLSVMKDHVSVAERIKNKTKIPSVSMHDLDGFVMTLAKNGADIMDITVNMYVAKESKPEPKEETKQKGFQLDGEDEVIDEEIEVENPQ